MTERTLRIPKYFQNFVHISGKMHMHDMVKIDRVVFEIVGGGVSFPGAPRV